MYSVYCKKGAKEGFSRFSMHFIEIKLTEDKMMKTYAIVLAAGKGTRMKSSLPKVMHHISGLPMVEHIVRKLEKLNVDEIVMITGHGAESIENHFHSDRVTFVRQDEQLGTAHAVMQAASLLENKSGKTLVLTGDTPLLSKESLKELLDKSNVADGVVLTTIQENPFGYGRILRDEEKNVIDIIEEKDASFEEKNIKEVNTGIFCFDNETLFSFIKEIGNFNAQNEFYLTDIVKVFNQHGKRFDSTTTYNHFEVMGINDRYQLSIAQDYHQKEIKKIHMLNGVTFTNQDSCYIEEDVSIEHDVLIESNVTLKGKTFIKSNAFIGSGSEIIDSIIGGDSKIIHSFIQESFIGKSVSVGPFAHIRPSSEIHDHVRIGNFVEIKKSLLEENAKVSHLSYIGDAKIGKSVNIGCGTITVNYDGKNKHKTVIEDGAFVGCNVNLMAPVTIGKNALVAAGSTITNDVPEDALGIAREKQVNKEGYAKKLKKS